MNLGAFAPILAMLVLATAFAVISIIVSAFLAPHRPKASSQRTGMSRTAQRAMSAESSARGTEPIHSLGRRSGCTCCVKYSVS